MRRKSWFNFCGAINFVCMGANCIKLLQQVDCACGTLNVFYHAQVKFSLPAPSSKCSFAMPKSILE